VNLKRICISTKANPAFKKALAGATGAVQRKFSAENFCAFLKSRVSELYHAKFS
jgi:hypothetical protein